MKATVLNEAGALTNVTALAVSPVACVLRRVQGYYAAAADAWLQIFDWSPISAASAPPAAGTVPTRCYALPNASPYSWAFDPAGLVLNNGCYIAVSSTEATFTAVAGAAATYLDIEADYEPFHFVPPDYTTVGDLTTAVNSLIVWADTTAGSPKRLYKLDYINGSGAAAWLMLFARSPANGDVPLVIIGGPAGIASRDSLNADFGGRGFPLSSFDQPPHLGGLHAVSGTALSSQEHVGHFGCFVYESSTRYTLTGTAGGTSCLRAYCK